MNRRELMILSAAGAVAAAVPNIPFVAPAAEPAKAWVVGTAGEMDWQFVNGATERAARLAWVSDSVGSHECDDGGEPDDNGDCDCEVCFGYRGCEVTRLAQFDGRGDISPADWLRAGMGHICSRCGNEAFRDDGGRAVGKDAICGDCMTLADWDIADPERAAEMRAEMAEEASA